MPPRWAAGCVSASPGSRIEDRIEALHTRNAKQDEVREKRRESSHRYACVRGGRRRMSGCFMRRDAVPGWAWGTRLSALICRRCGRWRRRGLNGSGLRWGVPFAGQR
jgi:hypothetical protein